MKDRIRAKSSNTDSTTTVQQLKDSAAELVRERDWEQFHSPKNMSMNIAIESAELMEKFLWMDGQESYKAVELNRQEIEQELADIVISACMLANMINADIAQIVALKMAEIKKKYPIDKAKGCSAKYTEL